MEGFIFQVDDVEALKDRILRLYLNADGGFLSCKQRSLAARGIS